MTDPTVVERARTAAAMAGHESVTAAVLAGREGRFASATPLAEPPVTYLAGTEAPAYVLTNGKRGVGLGSKRNTVTPGGERRTVVLITGRRTLCLVGRTDEDEVIEIPHASVASADYSTGFRAHRLVLWTPDRAYHPWVHRKTDESLLAAATDFLTDRAPADPEPMESDDTASRVMYRGRPVADDSEAATDSGSDGSGTVMYRGRPVDPEE